MGRVRVAAGGPDWLERELGLSRGLIRDLAAWARAWDARAGGTRELEREGERLLARLRAEIEPRRLTVVKGF